MYRCEDIHFTFLDKAHTGVAGVHSWVEEHVGTDLAIIAFGHPCSCTRDAVQGVWAGPGVVGKAVDGEIELGNAVGECQV